MGPESWILRRVREDVLAVMGVIIFFVAVPIFRRRRLGVRRHSAHGLLKPSGQAALER
jgi:hypothetical protein